MNASALKMKEVFAGADVSSAIEWKKKWFYWFCAVMVTTH